MNKAQTSRIRTRITADVGTGFVSQNADEETDLHPVLAFRQQIAEVSATVERALIAVHGDPGES